MDKELDAIISRVQRFLKEKELKKAILFGSFARGDQSEDSDVDLFIIDERFQGLDVIERARISWPLVERDFPWAADIICVTQAEFEHEVDMGMAAKDAREEGIVIAIK